MASDSRRGPARRGAPQRSRKLLEVLGALEEDEFSSNREEIFIAPSPNSASGDFTVEDSGEEDSGQNGAQLPGRVLCASVVSEDLDPQEEEDYDKPELQPAKKSGRQQRSLSAVGPRETSGQTSVAGQPQTLI